MARLRFIIIIAKRVYKIFLFLSFVSEKNERMKRTIMREKEKDREKKEMAKTRRKEQKRKRENIVKPMYNYVEEPPWPARSRKVAEERPRRSLHSYKAPPY